MADRGVGASLFSRPFSARSERERDRDERRHRRESGDEKERETERETIGRHTIYYTDLSASAQSLYFTAQAFSRVTKQRS